MQQLNFKKRGFTLVEMLVSISIFVLVAFTVTATLISVSNANRKAQELKQIMDNLNFSVQAMVLRMREGEDYTCTTLEGDPEVVTGGSDGLCNAIVFRDPTPKDGTDGVAVKYYLDSFDKPTGEVGGIVKVEGIGGASNVFQVTSEEVDIKELAFIVGGTGSESTDSPYVIIRINGEAKLRNVEEPSKFTLQTFVAQHKR